MRIAEAGILLVPGESCGPDHWMARWQRRMPNAAWVEAPGTADGAFAATLVARAQSAIRPVIIIAHSCGVLQTILAAPYLRPAVRGAFLVGPPDPDSVAGRSLCGDHGSVALDALPFPSLVVASRTDPHCSFQRAEVFAQAWRSLLIDAGDAGHLDQASGRGPWPEGLLLLSRLLRNIAGETLAGPTLPA